MTARRPLDPLTHLPEHTADDDTDPLAEARARAGRAVRDAGHALIGHAAPRELIDRLADTLTAITAELETYPVRDRAAERPTGDWAHAEPVDGEVMESFDERPVSGRASPWGLDVEVRRDGDEAVGRLTLRAAHEGAPGRSHGGVVAALFDDVFGFVLTMHSQPAFTGELGIRYRAGTPVGRPLECRVRLDRRQGRKILMTGELTDVGPGEGHGRVVATATATFIAIDPARFAAGSSSS